MRLILQWVVSMPTLRGLKFQIFLQFLKLLSISRKISKCCLQFVFNRNKFFVKFPGRELGGYFAFLKGFSNDVWLALAVFIVVIPAFLYFTYMVHMYFHSYETDNWIYGWNLLVFVAAVAQQVQY